MPELVPNARLARWRPTMFSQALASIWALAFVLAAIYCQLLTPWDTTNLLLGAVLLAIAALFTGFIGGVVDLYPDVLILDHWYRKRREVPLVDILDVEPTRWGLFIRLGPHQGLSGPIQVGIKNEVLTLLKVRTRGDRIARDIVEAAQAARH